MADASDKFGGGGSGVFVPIELSGALTVASGTSAGDLIVISPPAGKRVCLYKLSPSNGDQNGVTLSGSIQGQLITGVLSQSATGGGEFNIGTPRDFSVVGTIPFVFFEVDEVVTVSFSVSTTQVIRYQYAFGSVK